jgi:hypothetical protein
MAQPFYFYTRFNLIELLGKKARNLTELLDGIKSVPDSSIYYHTHRFLQQHHYLSPEPPNDFAYWITNVLQETALGEKVASIDIIQFSKIDDLRMGLIKILQDHLGKKKRRINCPEDAEFHFMICKTFILPTPYIATNVDEFREILRRISIDSLYFHIFEARLRLKKGENDFSKWLKNLGKEEVAKQISRLDPYTYTLEGLRQKIISLLEDGRYSRL